MTATPQDQLADAHKRKVVKGLTEDQVALMERESGNLDREFKMAEQSYGVDHLDLVLAKGFLASVVSNARVVRYLAQHHREILSEFSEDRRIEELGGLSHLSFTAELSTVGVGDLPPHKSQNFRVRLRTLAR